MKKFKEILFLKNLKRVANVTINKTYYGQLADSNDFDDFISRFKESETKFSLSDLEKAITKAENVFNYVADSDIEVITIFDDNYPKKLNIMENNKPPILYVKGDIGALDKPNIAVIGTRNPSQLSEDFEENLVKNVVNSTDKVVVSGLAFGCDKIAHQTTIDENKITVAVLPSGVDVIKPAKHKQLAEDIIKTGGCLVSEFEPKINVNRGSYIKRDKIVAAFCDATFVVECGVESGTMHTVNAASEYQRQIYAYLPDKRPKGSYDGNEFILSEFEDSIRVEDIDEFINDLGTIKSEKRPKVSEPTLDDF